LGTKNEESQFEEQVPSGVMQNRQIISTRQVGILEPGLNIELRNGPGVATKKSEAIT